MIGSWSSTTGADGYHAFTHYRCDIHSDLVAIWWSRKYALRLSGLVAEVLIQNKKLSAESLQLWRRYTSDR